MKNQQPLDLKILSQQGSETAGFIADLEGSASPQQAPTWTAEYAASGNEKTTQELFDEA